MLPDPQDTIVALSSAPGAGARAIVRLSGPSALRLAAGIFAGPAAEPGAQRFLRGAVRLEAIGRSLPADLYLLPAPATYTGQDLVEIHTRSSPPLVDALIGQLLNAGARAAQPGEFTLRAFLAGKLDLARAEAVLGIIEARDRDELKHALAQLAGGITRPLHSLREDLLNLLAEVEAGLDFGDEDLPLVGQKELLDRLTRGLAQVTLVQKQLKERALGDHPFRVVLAGPPNAGKSSLFNALAGADVALVSSEPGTTRDYLVRQLQIGGTRIELIDTAGCQAAVGVIEEQAQRLAQEQAEWADLVLYCVEAGAGMSQWEHLTASRGGFARRRAIATKCDLAEPPPELLGTSSRSGAGLDRLRDWLAEEASAHASPGLAPSLSRCQHHVHSCLEHLRQAHATVLYEDPPEVLALEVRGALEELGAMVGAIYTDDLLDRIFSRFCIGK